MMSPKRIVALLDDLKFALGAARTKEEETQLRAKVEIVQKIVNGRE